MSGHSHWSTIQRTKQAEDKKRGNLFSRLSREIAIAARSGPDPQANFKLRLSLERAKSANMPKEKIERAIKRGSGEGKREVMAEVFYEGFGPGGVGIIVEVMTDNRQRTTAEIRRIFESKGGSLAGPGAVAHQFRLMGLVAVEKEQSPQERILQIMDLGGVEDVEEAGDAIEVYTQPKDLEKVKKALEGLGLKVNNFGLMRKPLVAIPIKVKKTAEQILALMDELEEHDEVQRTDANFDIDPRLL